MVSKKEPEQKQEGMKRIFAAIAIIAAALFLLAAAAPASAPESSMQPASTTQNYTPNPIMNTNVTWSTHNSGWSPLEYSNGSANLSLNAQINAAYANPISVNPSDMQSSLLQTSTPIQWFNLSSLTAATLGANGGHNGYFIHKVNGQQALTLYANGSAAGANNIVIFWQIPVKDLPSSNLQYDYIQLAGSTTGTTETGFFASAIPENDTQGIQNTAQPYQTANGTIKLGTMTGNENFYEDINLAQWATLQNENYDTNTNPDYYISMQLAFPTGAAPNSTLTVTSVSLSTYQSNLLTQVINGTQQSPSAFLGQEMHISNVSNQVTIASSGYTVAVSQTIQNATEQQTSINDGSYTEQATYQGLFTLPTAPDLTYSASNISVALTISGKQYEVANLNGQSYLSAIQSKTNGTFSFGSVNPNGQNSIVLEVEYTTAQWDASSSAPSFFTLAGIEYYWWVAVLGVMGLIGLGSVAISHFGGEEETLRVPKGKYGR